MWSLSMRKHIYNILIYVSIAILLFMDLTGYIYKYPIITYLTLLVSATASFYHWTWVAGDNKSNIAFLVVCLVGLALFTFVYWMLLGKPPSIN